jgi:hypothetical protein
VSSAVVAWVAAASVLLAQQPPPLTEGDFQAMRERVAQSAPSASEEWIVAFSASARRGHVVALPAPARRPPGPPLARERDPQLSGDRLVVVAVDADGTPTDVRIVPDPRIVRAETPDATGLLSGTVLMYPDVELRVTLTASPDTRELRVYQPRWTGDAWALDPIAVSPVQ